MRSGRLVFALSAAVAAASASACTQDPVEVSLRSLERSGAVAFVCLGSPASGAAPRPLSACTAEEADTPVDFGRGTANQGELPHLYALVTQMTRGEVAVIDLSADEGNVLDQDDATPGPTFLPVGAQPVDVVATPGGTAAFVTAAEPTRPAIYAIPTARIRPCEVDPSRCDEPPPTLSSWPTCTLPAAPGEAVLAFDPPTADGAVRGACDGAGADPAGPNGDLVAEGQGRQKLIVALPTLGQLAVIDAQRLLDRAAGDLAPCEIERTVELAVDVATGSGEPPYEDGPACVVPEGHGPRPQRAFASTPSGLWLSGDRLYVGDLTAPVVHVLEASSACDLEELPPLLATSREDPERIVATSRVAASERLGPDFARYVYAVDVEDRSLMVFDVSDDAESREPLARPNAALNPLQPPDRLRFGAAPQDVIVVERDVPATHPGTGVAPYATRCDPDPTAVVCDPGVTSCDLGTLYRTTGDYEEGAGPFTLRGTFAFVALSDGRVAVVDIDDYDAACRGPTVPSTLYGCAQEGLPPGQEPLVTSDPAGRGEASCNVVVPHALRSSSYIDTNDLVGRRQPGIATFPLLYRKDGTVVEEQDAPGAPRMRAVLPATNLAVPYELVVGNDVREIGAGGAEPDLVVDAEGKVRHTLAVTLEEPRVHTNDQAWSVTYEGVIPGIAGRVGDLRLRESPPTFHDAAGAFCERGVQGAAAVREQLELEEPPAEDIDDLALALADRLVVTQELAGADDPSWDGASCSFQQCLATFGDRANPSRSRDFAIVEAYGGHFVLAPPASALTVDEVECCFPALVEYEVRAGGQWVVTGEAIGFLHHVVEDPGTGACRDSCDPRLELLRGRVRTAPSAPVEASSRFAFASPFFRFAITADPATLVRDLSFRFQTQGQFVPLFASLTAETENVLPQTISYVPSTGELAVADGSLEGLMLVSTRTMQLERQFF
jgi:hypothetical protein